MNTRVLLLGCLLALSAQAQESKRDMWTWKDANGVTQFSDRPVPGARKITINSSSPAPVAGPVTSAPPPPAATRPASPAAVSYQSLEIWAPESGESFFGADATVNVRLRSEPAVGPGDRLLLYLDGKLVEGSGNSYEYTLASLERGAHSLSAVIIDTAGTEKIRSAPRVFHVRQPSTVPAAAVGPKLKPPPKPKAN
jgi:hypothetical protein